MNYLNYKTIDQPLIFSFRPLKAANVLFLDRDGVLNQTVLRKSEVSSPRLLEEIKIAEDVSALAESEIVSHWNLVVISNQPDLARGTINIEFINAVNNLINQSVPLNAVYICPHQESDHCICRKPEAGLIQLFRRDHSHVKGKECLVGDRSNDRDCAIKAEIPFVLRKRSYNSNIESSIQYAIDDLKDLKHILRKII